MFTMALAGRAVTAWAGDPGAVVEYGVRFTARWSCRTTTRGRGHRPRGGQARSPDDGRLRVDLTVTSGGEKVLSLARAIVRAA